MGKDTVTVSFEFDVSVGDIVMLRSELATALEAASHGMRPSNGLRALEVESLMVEQCHGGTQGFVRVRDTEGRLMPIAHHSVVPHDIASRAVTKAVRGYLDPEPATPAPGKEP